MPTTAKRAWKPGPLRPDLSHGALHVWLADLAAAEEGGADTLSEEERARAARFLSERDRVLWMRSRQVLRALLGRYLGREPHTVRMTSDCYGKPALVEQGAGLSDAGPAGVAGASALAFNLSHSDSLALYAFSRMGPVGVDVEVARRPIDAVAIATRTLGVQEARRLSAIADPASRQREFLRVWTRHEAGLKCLGTGIGGSATVADIKSLWAIELCIGPGAAAALAAIEAPTDISRWSWTQVAA